MIANVSAHRRANAFAQALEDSDRGAAAEQSEGSPPAEDSAQARLLSLTAGLAELPKPALDPEVKVVQRAQLVAAMEAMLQGGEAPSVPEQRGHRAAKHRALGRLRPTSRLAKGLTAGGLSVSVAAGAFGGVAAASSDALPGDSLYGLKRGIEDFKLTYLTDDDTERGQAYLDQASTRLNEARRLLDRGRGSHLDHESVGEIRRTLSGMTHDATEGHRLLHAAYERDPESLGPIQALSAFSRSHREVWGSLRDSLPVQLGDVSEQVTSVFDAMDEEVAPLQSLFPQPPSQGTNTSHAPGTTPSGTKDSHQSPTHPDANSTPGGHSTTPGHSTPPAASSPSSDDGLLGGNTGGLLDPPKNLPTTPALPSANPPDVTIPPLLPGLLPGLGINSEDAE
ncbi:DUF5667 domain-containing protein [Streptomyces sp. NPDC004539]|uniref:DUF5667 domain-containing protein n=1 Tax=Streptomyces sp. NPDC004539 TaxID=3154280 RepID=UPI0033BE8262